MQTLGELSLVDRDFNKAKPLLLLTYLNVEGVKNRRYLAELFWPGAVNHLNSLSKALSQLRSADEQIVQTDRSKAWTTIPSDVTKLMNCLDDGQAKEALKLYKSPFLQDFYLPISQ